MFSIRSYSLIFVCILTILSFGSQVRAEEGGAKKIKRKPTSVVGKVQCFDVQVSGRKDIDFLFAHVPEKRSPKYFLMNLNAAKGENYWMGSFTCYSEKAKDHYQCAGDDDAGRFGLHLDGKQMSLTINYLSFGDPDEPGPLFSPKPKGDKPEQLAGTAAACR